MRTQSKSLVVFLFVVMVGSVVAARQNLSMDERLKQARTQAAAGDLAAVQTLVDDLTARVKQDIAAAKPLAAALEVRGCAKLAAGDRNAATADLTQLLQYDPAHEMQMQTAPPCMDLFSKVKQDNLGFLDVQVTPADADLIFQGTTIVSALARPIPVPKGSYTGMIITRPGFTTYKHQFPVMISAGSIRKIDPITMQRESPTLTIVTSPVGAEVYVDNALQGTTTAGALRPEDREWAKQQQIRDDAVSAGLKLVRSSAGTVTVEARMECYGTQRVTVTVPASGDAPVQLRLPQTAGSIEVGAASQGASIYLDEETKPRGTAPLTITGVCAGSHTVQLRSPQGRAVSLVSVTPNTTASVSATPRPAFALLSSTPADVSSQLQQAFGSVNSIALFAPPRADVERVQREAGVGAGWIRPDSGTPDNARVEATTKVAKALDAQGLADFAVQPDGSVHLMLLAPGQGKPDVLDVALTNQETVKAMVNRFNNSVPSSFTKPWTGVEVIEVLSGNPAPAPERYLIVSDVDTSMPQASGQSTLARGDVVTKVDNKVVASLKDYEAALSQKKGGDLMMLSARGADNREKTVRLAVLVTPRLISVFDKTLMVSTLVPSLRALEADTSKDANSRTIARANLAVALYAGGNYTEASNQLANVTFVDGTGVSYGTVQYLLGLCYEKMGRQNDATAAFLNAARTKALLTEDGPSIKELAQAKLGLGTN